MNCEIFKFKKKIKIYSKKVNMSKKNRFFVNRKNAS